MEFDTFISRILIALVCGAMIGLERQWHHKNAGLRTNTLVAIGAAIFVTMSFQLDIENGDMT